MPAKTIRLKSLRHAIALVRWFALAVCAAGLLFSQTTAQPMKGTVERVKVHGKSLGGNHTNRVADRIETKMVSFFSANLAAK